MAHELIPTAVLSDRLTDALRGRRVKAAVFTTFSFEPAFFEQEVLPILFEQSFSHVEAVRLMQLEEALLKAQPLAVYYDRAALLASAGAARLDVRRIGVSRGTGCFHPKIIAVLVDETDSKTGVTTTSLVLAVMSANLTRAGWWENVECAEILELQAGTKCSFRKELQEAFRAIRRDAHRGESHEALDEIERFVKRLEDEPRRSSGGVLHPRLYSGQSTVAEFLRAELKLPPGVFHLEVISPYFDEAGGPSTLTRLIDELQPKTTTVFLPKKEDATALCREDLFDAVNDLPNVRWGKLPSQMLRRSKSTDEGQPERFVHAKIYRLWSQAQGKEYVLVGSVNLTGPAHRDARKGAGNLEIAILLQGEDSRAPRRWLDPLDDDYRPGAFEVTGSEDELPEVAPPPVTVVYAWDTGKASYFWESTSGSPPTVAVLWCAGVEIARIEPIVRGEWRALSDECAAELRDRLNGTSFVDVAVDGQPPAAILVREEGMHKKPSLLTRLTAAEILTYWSLLSAEQREVFLDKRYSELLAQQGITLPHGKVVATTSSLFDRFAGIFHAFARLEEHVSSAIEGKHATEAVYRLFGEKYDSLPSLIKKVMQEADADPVNQYVTLLSAKQLVRRLESKSKAHVEFFDSHTTQLADLSRSLDCIETVRASFDFDGPDERSQFFRWFDRRFLEDARRPAEET